MHHYERTKVDCFALLSSHTHCSTLKGICFLINVSFDVAKMTVLTISFRTRRHISKATSPRPSLIISSARLQIAQRKTPCRWTLSRSYYRCNYSRAQSTYIVTLYAAIRALSRTYLNVRMCSVQPVCGCTLKPGWKSIFFQCNYKIFHTFNSDDGWCTKKKTPLIFDVILFRKEAAGWVTTRKSSQAPFLPFSWALFLNFILLSMTCIISDTIQERW